MRVVRTVVTGVSMGGRGFDLVLDPEHVRMIGFTPVQCSEIPPEIPRITLPVDLVLNGECLDDLHLYLQENCPGLVEWLQGVMDVVGQIRGSHAFLDLVANPSVDGQCGEELCYWDARLRRVVCVE